MVIIVKCFKGKVLIPSCETLSGQIGTLSGRIKNFAQTIFFKTAEWVRHILPILLFQSFVF